MTTSTALPPVIPPRLLDDLLRRAPGAVRLLDVRTPGEFESMHIPGAYNVPLETLGEHALEIEAHVEAPVVLICQSGQRARKAEAALRTAGMANLHVLDGGVTGWNQAALPLRRGAERISLERQVRMAAGAIVAAGAGLALAASPLFALVPLAVGSGLLVAGATNTCLMGTLLAHLPYNRPATCDVGAMVTALKAGAEPAVQR